MKKAYMKSFYLPAVRKGWVKFNQALYDYLGGDQMRYILDVSGHDLKLIRASIVNFQRSLEMSNHAEFDNIIDDLDHVFFKISRMKKEQLDNKIKRKWWKK